MRVVFFPPPYLPPSQLAMASFVIERSTSASRAKELATFIAEAGLSNNVAPATASAKAVYELTPEGVAFMERARSLVEPGGGAAKPQYADFLSLALGHIPRMFDGTVGDQGACAAGVAGGEGVRCRLRSSVAAAPGLPLTARCTLVIRHICAPMMWCSCSLGACV